MMDEKIAEAIETLANASVAISEDIRLIKKLLLVEMEILKEIKREKDGNVVPFTQNLHNTCK